MHVSDRGLYSPYLLPPPTLGKHPHPGLARCGIQRLPAQVLPVQLDQVEGIEEDMPVLAPAAQPIEARHAVPVAGDRLSSIRKEGARIAPAALAIKGKRSVQSMPWVCFD
jgi:hypothetical protein